MLFLTNVWARKIFSGFFSSSLVSKSFIYAQFPSFLLGLLAYDGIKRGKEKKRKEKKRKEKKRKEKKRKERMKKSE